MKSRWVMLALGFTMMAAVAAPASASAPISWSELQDPPVEYRPWARWWWPGNDVDDAELRREIFLLRDQGFGGVEVQPFTMGLDPKAGKDELARRMSFDTDDYYHHLATVMQAAQEAGLGVDLTLGSGWPSGGAHIDPAHGMKTLLHSEQAVSGPRRVRLKVAGPDKPVFYTVANLGNQLLHMPIASYFGDRAELVAVIAGRVIGGKRTRGALDFSDTLTLDPASIQVLTGQVDSAGMLQWDAPPGKWVLINVYLAPDGEYPTLAAQDPPGFVADHFDRDTVLGHLDHLLGARTGLTTFYGQPLRAFFNDSFEFKAERMFASDFLAEFQKRRGYDLTPYLPAVLVPGADDSFYNLIAPNAQPEYQLSDHDARIRYDYSLTVSDLFIERFLDPTVEFAHARGLKSRVQCYGLNIDVLRAMGHVDIPETEMLYAGGADMFLKMASSGAALYNKPLVTAESMVWAGRAGYTTPLKIKAGAAKLWLAGVNGIIYHGYPYKKPGRHYGPDGWYPWASKVGNFSSNLSEVWPYWSEIKEINQYIARGQYLLRQGKPHIDVLVYYPFLGFPDAFSNVKGHDELLFTGKFDNEPQAGNKGTNALAKIFGQPGPPEPRVQWLLKVWPMIKDFQDRGTQWAWVNDESLAEAEYRDGKIVIRGNAYSGVIMAHAPGIQAATAANLVALARLGAAVMVVGDPPAALHAAGGIEPMGLLTWSRSPELSATVSRWARKTVRDLNDGSVAAVVLNVTEDAHLVKWVNRGAGCRLIGLERGEEPAADALIEIGAYGGVGVICPAGGSITIFDADEKLP
jgi:hypothetical protein